MADHGDVRYWSKSRSEFVEIGPMPTRHLSNAAKKLCREVVVFAGGDEPTEYPATHGQPEEVLCAMIDELASRVPAVNAPEQAPDFPS